MQQSNPEQLQEINFDILSVALRSDGIMYVKIKGNEEAEIKHVKQVVGAMEEIGNGKKFPLLIVVDEFTLPSAETREYAAKFEANPYASAEAFVIQSLSQKLAANFYLGFNKPARPTKIFNSEKKAIAWLKTFL